MHHTVEVSQGAFTFEAGAAFDVEFDDVCLSGERRGELRAARAE